MKKQLYLFIMSGFVLGVIAGCSTTSDVIDEPQAQEATQETMSAPEPVAMAEPEPENTLETIFYFDYDDATLRPNVRQALQAQAEHLKANPQPVRIEGYADERGTEEYNKELGQRRAEAVRDLLVSFGVSSSQIETVSYGEKNPLMVGGNEAAWQKNRRVELK